MRRGIRWVILLAVVAVAIDGFFIEPSRLVVRHHSLTLPDLPVELSGIRIAIISDIHAGSPFVKEAKLRRIVRETNREKPDVILLLGDYVSAAVLGGKRIAPETLAPILGEFRSPLGTFAVLGNHDGWLGAPRVRQAFEQAGIRVLRNEHARVEWSAGDLAGERRRVGGAGPLSLYGLADLRTDKPNVDRIAEIPAPVIVMTHSPDPFPSIRTPVVLTVAGHTHGGQVRLPLIGATIVPSVYGRRYAAGHIIERAQHLFVTTGIGTSLLPIRIGVTPEIAILSLTSSRPAARPSPTRSSRSSL
jgi:predicted MPP superfamily phosphohydrolase